MKPPGAVRLRVIPIPLREANEFVELVHRHHRPVVGHKYSLAAMDPEGRVRGVAICGRPVGRKVVGSAEGRTIEVSRVASDGTPNACSALYGAAIREAWKRGATRVITYTLEAEPGTSLVAANATREGRAGKPGGWNGRGRVRKHPVGWKTRWSWSREVS